MPIKIIEGIEVNFEPANKDEGRPPIVWVPGACHDQRCWQEHFLPHFAEAGFDGYALSLRGHGQSAIAKPLAFATQGDYLHDIHIVVRSLGTRPILVGHSMGAHLAQLYANNNHLAGLVLLAPPPPWGVLPSVLRLFRKRFAPMFLNHLLWTWKFVSKEPKHAKVAFFHPNLGDKELNKYVGMLGDEAAFAYFQMFVPRLGRSNIGCPVRVMHAELDQIFTNREVEATARKLGVRPVSLPQTAHDIMLDPNWKFAAEDLVRWMRTLKQ